jgi:hypothetical protein
MADPTEAPNSPAALPGSWLAGLGLPLLAACGSFTAALAVGDEPGWLSALLLIPVVLTPTIWIGMLAYLAIASDTNGARGGEVVELAQADSDELAPREQLAA